MKQIPYCGGRKLFGFRLPRYIAKSFGFACTFLAWFFLFLPKQNPKDFEDFIKNVYSCDLNPETCIVKVPVGKLAF